jgi:chromosome segregation ATPase
MRTVLEIEEERAQVAQELAHLQAKRGELKARTILLNRQRGVSKRDIANLRAQDMEYLEQAEAIKRRLHDLKLERREANMEMSQGRSGQVEQSVAQRFVQIASRVLPRELYEDILQKAAGE